MYEPAGEINEVGGDFYEVFRVVDGWAIVLGDVSGKGAAAAALTAEARHTIRTAGALASDPCAGLHLLDGTCASATTRRCARRRCWCCPTIRTASCEVTVYLAGHPHPLLVRGGEVEPVGDPGPLLGVVDDPIWEPAPRSTIAAGRSADPLHRRRDRGPPARAASASANERLQRGLAGSDDARQETIDAGPRGARGLRAPRQRRRTTPALVAIRARRPRATGRARRGSTRGEPGDAPRRRRSRRSRSAARRRIVSIPSRRPAARIFARSLSPGWSPTRSALRRPLRRSVSDPSPAWRHARGRRALGARAALVGRAHSRYSRRLICGLVGLRLRLARRLDRLVGVEACWCSRRWSSGSSRLGDLTIDWSVSR